MEKRILKSPNNKSYLDDEYEELEKYNIYENETKMNRKQKLERDRVKRLKY